MCDTVNSFWVTRVSKTSLKIGYSSLENTLTVAQARALLRNITDPERVPYLVDSLTDEVEVIDNKTAREMAVILPKMIC